MSALLLGGALIVAVACGGDDPTPTTRPATSVPPTSAPPTAIPPTVGAGTVAPPTAVPPTSVPPTTAAPTATTAPTGGGFDIPTPDTPSGEAVLVFGAGAVGDSNGRNQAQSAEIIHYYGIAETMFLRGADDTAQPWLASAFEVASDLSSATLTIAEGAKFHTRDGSDFGFLTAHDVAFSMNDANATTNPNSIHGQAGDFAGLFREFIAVDDRTIQFEFESYDVSWTDDFLNQSGQSLSIFSERAFLEKGADYVRDNVVSTGPFQDVEWLRDTKLVMEAVPNHWKFDPKTPRITILEVSESTTRAAMLRSGEADVAAVIAADAPGFINGGFGATGTGGGAQEGIFFAGNLWEKYSAREGEGEGEPNEKLLIRDTYGNDFPWIGDPFSTSDPNDMEEARQVRFAMAIAIDRQSIVDNVLAGLGKVNHVQYFDSEHVNWDPKWEYYYDPVEAADIISGLDANYFKGSGNANNLNGNAFEVSIYSQDGSLTIRGEIADAVAGYWSALGLEVFSLKFAYRSFRPTIVARSNVFPWLTNCDKGNDSWQWSNPKGLVQSSLSRGGFSCGFETPEITAFYQRMATAADTATATQAANEYLDYVYFWNLQPSVVTTPQDLYFNPLKIASWEQGKANASSTGDYWNLTLK